MGVNYSKDLNLCEFDMENRCTKSRYHMVKYCLDRGKK